MNHHNLIAIDIAKSSFHAVRLKNSKLTTDKAFNRQQLKTWLAKQTKTTVVIEACGSAHYWARYAQSHGHNAQLIAPKHVSAFRQGHKTDRNDALAIAMAFTAPNTKCVAIKTVEQQALQSIERIRQHLTDNQTAVSNMIRGLLSEFGIEINKGASFANGREASACIGLTPKQYSTGGVVVLGSIGKKSGNKRLRSTLIQGALSVVKAVDRRVPKNTKEQWLKSLIERVGKRRAAVALANKTIRTAWAILKHGEDYRIPCAV